MLVQAADGPPSQMDESSIWVSVREAVQSRVKVASFARSLAPLGHTLICDAHNSPAAAGAAKVPPSGAASLPSIELLTLRRQAGR